MTQIIINVLFFIIIMCAVWAYRKLYDEKEKYRCRVLELTKGKEGSNLVNVIPDTPPPTPPVKEEPKPKVVKMRSHWRFINLETVGDQSCLERMSNEIQKEGYTYITGNSGHPTILAFHKVWTEEIKEDNDNE